MQVEHRCRPRRCRRPWRRRRAPTCQWKNTCKGQSTRPCLPRCGAKDLLLIATIHPRPRQGGERGYGFHSLSVHRTILQHLSHAHIDRGLRVPKLLRWPSKSFKSARDAAAPASRPRSAPRCERRSVIPVSILFYCSDCLGIIPTFENFQF